MIRKRNELGGAHYDPISIMFETERSQFCFLDLYTFDSANRIQIQFFDFNIDFFWFGDIKIEIPLELLLLFHRVFIFHNTSQNANIENQNDKCNDIELKVLLDIDIFSCHFYN